MKREFDIYIKKHDLKNCERLFISLDEKERSSKTMIAFSVILKIARIEEDNGIKGLFYRGDCKTLDELVDLYYRIKYFLRRIEYDIKLDFSNEFVNLNISKYMLLMMISLFSLNKIKVADYIKNLYSNAGNKRMYQILNEFLWKAEKMELESMK